MEGYQVSATVYTYNNPSQKKLQKMITKLNEIYGCPEYNNIVATKIYDNGLTRGVKIEVFCWSLQEVNKQIGLLSLNITNLLGEYIPDGFLPTIKINLIRKL